MRRYLTTTLLLLLLPGMALAARLTLGYTESTVALSHCTLYYCVGAGCTDMRTQRLRADGSGSDVISGREVIIPTTDGDTVIRAQMSCTNADGDESPRSALVTCTLSGTTWDCV